jgi:hypothetical protein
MRGVALSLIFPSHFWERPVAFSLLRKSRLMQEDVTNDRNVSNRRIFKPTNRLYCENTATVDFVAIFFS